MADEPGIGPGHSGGWVLYLQQYLNHHYQTTVVDENSEYDEATASAVAHLRQQNDLGEGAVDASVWAILAGTAPADATPAMADDRDDSSPEYREREREAHAVTRDAGDGDDLESWFQSDWAGRAILARWLAGDGDWTLDHDPAWVEYMRDNDSLREKLAGHAAYLVANTAALGDDEGVINVNEEFHVDIENGEGIVGYQYLHGTNGTVGDFWITGWARLVPTADPSDTDHTSGHRRVHYYLEYTWNDMIDPNARYGTDVFKSAIGYAITAGAAADYRITITFSGEGVAVVDDNGHVLEIQTTSDSGDTLDGYPLN